MGLIEFTPDSAGCEITGNVLWLRGEHDASTAAEVFDAIVCLMGAQQRDLIIDLSDVQFMGVAIVNVIFRATKFIDSSSRSLSLRNPSAPARRVLDACRMNYRPVGLSSTG